MDVPPIVVKGEGEGRTSGDGAGRGQVERSPGLVMASSDIGNLRPLLKSIYAVAALIFIVPFIDLLAGAFPFRPGEANWRFGIAGIALKTLPTPLLGLAMAMAVSAFLEHRRVLRILAVLAMVAGVVSAFIIAAFTLDFIQLRGTVRPGFRRGMDTASLTAVVIAGLLVPTAVGLGVGGWITSRSPSRKRKTRSGTGGNRALLNSTQENPS